MSGERKLTSKDLEDGFYFTDEGANILDKDGNVVDSIKKEAGNMKEFMEAVEKRVASQKITAETIYKELSDAFKIENKTQFLQTLTKYLTGDCEKTLLSEALEKLLPDINGKPFKGKCDIKTLESFSDLCAKLEKEKKLPSEVRPIHIAVNTAINGIIHNRKNLPKQNNQGKENVERVVEFGKDVTNSQGGYFKQTFKDEPTDSPEQPIQAKQLQIDKILSGVKTIY